MESNLLEAMYRLEQTGIDVVLLDLGMPELNGYKSYRAIESVAGRPLPVVILTADDRRLRGSSLWDSALPTICQAADLPVRAPASASQRGVGQPGLSC